MSALTPVQPADPGKKTSEILGPSSDEATVKMDLQNAKCLWNDAEFAQGDRVSVDGACYECSFGRWLPVDD
jgi:hypothetical protein